MDLYDVPVPVGTIGNDAASFVHTCNIIIMIKDLRSTLDADASNFWLDLRCNIIGLYYILCNKQKGCARMRLVVYALSCPSTMVIGGWPVSY